MAQQGQELQWSIENLVGKNIAILRIHGELSIDTRGEFKEATRELLQQAMPSLVIDLSKIKRFASLYIGTLTDVAAQAVPAGKILSVLLGERLARVCEQAGLDKVVNIIVV